MKRTRVIRLVLLGGGVATMIAACGDDRAAQRRACEEARAALRPDAEQICQRSVAGSGGGAGWLWMMGRSRPDTRVAAPAVPPGRPAAAPAPSNRGGFGGSAFSFSSGG